jgi:XPG N-terminal domain
MGIHGLLPLLGSITTAVHVSEYFGRRVAIDAYGWLHKGAYSCSRQLCEGTPTDMCGLLPAHCSHCLWDSADHHVSPDVTPLRQARDVLRGAGASAAGIWRGAGDGV